MADEEAAVVDSEVATETNGEAESPAPRGRPRGSGAREVKVEIKQTEIVPAGEQSGLLKGGRVQGDPYGHVMPASKHRAKWLDDHWQDEDKTGWSLSVSRLGPTTWDGVRLTLKKPLFDAIPMRAFEEIKNDVVSNFGGGDYRLIVRDQTGSEPQSVITFKIPSHEMAPIVSDHERSGGLSMFTGTAEIPDGSVPVPEQSKEVVEAKTRLAKMNVESEIKRKERDEREDDEEFRNRKENKSMNPLRIEIDAKMDKIQTKIEASQAANDVKFERLMVQLQQPKPQDNSFEKMMSAMTAIMAPLMQVVSKRDETQGNKEVEAIKAQGEMQRQHSQAMMEMLKASADKNEKFFTTFIQPMMTQIAKPENPKKAILESMELIKMIKEEMGGGEQEAAAPVTYNPEMSPMENMFGAIATWLQKRNAAGAPTPPPYPQMNPPPAQAPHGLETFELETPNIPMPPPARPAPALPPAVDTPEARLRFTVTESMRTALKEARESALAATWPQDAHATWAPTFQDQLASAPHDGARMDLIKAQCDPRIWTELELYLTSKQQIYRVFMSGLRDLVAQVVEVKAPAASGTI